MAKFKYFVEVEKRRFLKALDIITRDRSQGTVCDLGCFIPYLPLALATIGFDVKIVDKYALYGSRFRDEIFRLAESKSIQVFDLDIVNDGFETLGQNDVVLLMAVVEHLNGSPRYLLEKIHAIIGSDGFFVFEVPNIAELVKRFRAFLGFSPLADYHDYFHSAYPFTGHNREMTVPEVFYMLEHAGFSVEHCDCYDYSKDAVVTWKGRLALSLKAFIPMKHKGQSIIAKARPCGLSTHQ